MLKDQNKLELLSKAYVTYLIQRDESILKKFLSLNFIRRQKVSEQLKFINLLPQLFYGIGIEIQLFENYNTVNTNDELIISPFQFQVTYTPHVNLSEMEKITLTLHSVIHEDNEWKIGSIISDDEKDILIKVTNNLQNKKEQNISQTNDKNKSII